MRSLFHGCCGLLRSAARRRQHEIRNLICVLQRVGDHSADPRCDLLAVTQTQFHLRRMDVHIQKFRRDRKIQRGKRKTMLHQVRSVGLLDRRADVRRPDIAAVDVIVFERARAAADERFSNKAAQPDPFALRFHGHRAGLDLAAEDAVDQLGDIPVSGRKQLLAAVHFIAETDIGPRHGQLLHQIADVVRLGLGRSQKFASDRGVVKQIAHHESRSVRCAYGLEPEFLPAFDSVQTSQYSVLRLRRDLYLRDCRDARKRLSAEPQRPYGQKIRGIPYLTGRVTQKGSRQILFGHAGAVVRNPYEIDAAAGDLHRDRRSAGVDGVFAEFLNDALRAVDDLARRDTVDRRGIENMNHIAAPFSPRLRSGRSSRRDPLPKTHIPVGSLSSSRDSCAPYR